MHNPAQALVHILAQARETDIQDNFFQTLAREDAKVIEILERQDLSQRNMATVLESLEFANDRLATAMHRIGYLEGKIEYLEEQNSILPMIESIANRVPELEQESLDLRTLLIERELHLAETHLELKVANERLELVRSSWWCRFWAWLTDTPV
jgi:DNA repair exonuclease SbcCD ATPase subunit